MRPSMLFITVVGLLTGITGCHRPERDTPLTAAAAIGDLPAVQEAIREGADPDRSSGSNGWTPLMRGIHKNQQAVVY